MVEYYIGKRSRFTYAKEVTYATAPGSSAWGYIPAQTVTPTSKSDIEAINVIDSSPTRDVSSYFETLRTYGATVDGLIQHFGFCTLAWGTDDHIGSTHTITPATNIPSFSMNFGYDSSSGNDHIMELLGGKINKLDISCTKGEFLKFSAEIVAQKGATTPSWRSPSAGSDVTQFYTSIAMPAYHYSGSDVEINGTTYCNTESIKLSINNNLHSEPVLCSTNGKRISESVPQIREYDASVTIRMKEPDLYDLWEDDAYLPNDTTFTFTSGSRILTFTLNNVRIESAISPLNISEGIVLVELPMKCTSIGVTEVNTLSGDY